MNEEEKQVIEDTEKIKDLKAVYSGAVQAGEISIANMIKSGINLIEKLQKENEELKYKYNKALSDVIAGVDLDSTYISKQKIKDKIEEYKHRDFIKMQVVMRHDKQALKIVEVLQELLEEKGE